MHQRYNRLYHELIVCIFIEASHDYGKDSGMYILPGCIANVNSKLLSKDNTSSPNNEKF